LGCEGWSYDEVLPYFKKSEKQENEHWRDGKDGPSAGYHGYDGPLTVSNQRIHTAISDSFIAAMGQLGLNNPGGGATLNSIAHLGVDHNDQSNHQVYRSRTISTRETKKVLQVYSQPLTCDNPG